MPARSIATQATSIRQMVRVSSVRAGPRYRPPEVFWKLDQTRTKVQTSIQLVNGWRSWEACFRRTMLASEMLRLLQGDGSAQPI
jgi:hypothetical protein